MMNYDNDPHIVGRDGESRKRELYVAGFNPGGGGYSSILAI